MGYQKGANYEEVVYCIITNCLVQLTNCFTRCTIQKYNWPCL